MENEEEVWGKIEKGAELGPPPGRPETLTGFIDMASQNPEYLGLFFSDDDIRALVPNPRLSEQIIEAAHRHEAQSDS